MQALLQITLTALVLAQAASPLHAQDSPFLDSVLHSLPIFRDSIAPDLERYELQVLYRPLFGADSGQTQRWHVDPNRYYYPASTVKLPIAALALEQLNLMGVVGLTSDSPMSVDSVRAPQSSSRERIGVPGQLATVGGHVRDIAAVSSNEAYNRLFEWLGQRHINEALHRRGYRTRITHRLSVSGFDSTENRFLPPVTFRHVETGDTVLFRGAAFAKTPYAETRTHSVKGRGYINADDQLVNEPFDMSGKNYLGLEDLTDVVQSIVAPETVDSTKRFAIGAADHEMLVRAMRTPPSGSDNPSHHKEPDGYVKFLYYGGEGAFEPDGPIIYNKVGDAYGTLTDAALFEDPATGRRFMLAATLLVNRNGVFNDGKYEYEGVGFPLMRDLGRAIYASAR